MVRELCKWLEKEYKKCEEEGDTKSLVKAFGIGYLEGAIDSCIISGAVWTVASIVKRH